MAHPTRHRLNEIQSLAAAAAAVAARASAPVVRTGLRAGIKVGALARALLGSSALISAPSVNAQTVLPQGGRVMAGGASITSAGTGTTITQTSARAVVDWTSFSVGAGDNVRFIQPDTQSAILNRVTGSATSTIAGQITGNGQVYLINPNGIAITATGSVQLGGGFVAATLDMADADFMGGKLAFKGNGASAPVTNDGNIAIGSGGFAALLGGNVANSGVVSVPLGKIALGAGEAATLDLNGDGFLQVALPTSLGGRGSLVSAGGVMSGARIELRAASLVGAVRDAVNVSGDLVATGAHMDGGALVIDGGAGAVAVSGQLDAASASAAGGTISVGGGHIALTGAQIDASGATGGGAVTVGGGSHGAAVAGLTTADSVAIDAGTTIKADARVSGNGGQVTVWSNDDTRFTGAISAQALGAAGDGGKAEVSGGNLDYRGTTNLLAAHGKTGNLLLDPWNVTIGSTDNNDSGFVPTATGASISATTLVNALNTANVTVTTGTTGAEAGNITVSNAVTWTSANTLTLSAAGSIAVNANLTGAAGSQIVLSADTGATGTGTVTFQSTSIKATATGGVTIYYNPTALGTAKNYSSNAGTGTTIKGYMLLNTLSDLQNFYYQNAAGNYALNTNIDLTSVAFTPIGNNSSPFTGSFDGQYHTITNLTINQPGSSYLGLFGGYSSASGSIKNLGLVGGTITGTTSLGALVGTMGAGTISNVWSSVTVTGSSTGGNIGGLVGDANGATITTSYATGSVSGNNSVGGLIGAAVNTTLTNVYATGSVTGIGTSPTEAGGLAGFASGSSSISKSFATGLVSGFTAATSGGLVGELLNTSSLTTSYFNTTTTGQSAAIGTNTSTGSVSATGLTTAQMQNSANYTGWDFANTWITPATGRYPLLLALTPDFFSGGSLTISNSANSSTNVNVTLLQNDLATASTTVSASTGTITVVDPVTWSSAYSLTLNAATGIVLNNSITNTNAASALTLNAGGTGGISGSGALVNSGALSLSNASGISSSLSSAISGGGAVTYAGAGTLTLAGTNSFTGALTVSSGTLMAGSTSAFGNNSAVTLATGAILDLNGNSVSIGSLAGSGMVQDGSATAATLTTGGANTSTSFSGNIQNGTGTLSLTKTGTATQTLTGANTYTGATTVNAGTLSLGSAGAIGGASAVSVNSGGTLNIAGVSATLGTGGTLTLNTGSTLSGTGSLTVPAVTGNATGIYGNVAINGGSGLTLSSSSLNGYSYGLYLASGAALTTTGTVTLNATGTGTAGTNHALQTAGAVTINAASGALTFNVTPTAADDGAAWGGTPTFGGNVTMNVASNYGTYAFSADTTPNITLLANANLTINANSGSVGTTIATTGTTWTLGTGATVSVNGTKSVNLNGSWTVTGGTVNIAAPVSIGGASTISDPGALNISGVISGTSGLTFTGGGIATLTGINTYSGGTTVNAGTVIATVAPAQDSLGTGAASIASGATLELNNTNATTSNVTIGNTFTGAGTLNLNFNDTNTANTIMGGVTGFNGNIALTAAGSTGDKWNTSNLSGTMPFSLSIGSGTTLYQSTSMNVSGGISLVGTGNSDGWGAIRLDGGATLGGNIQLLGNAYIGDNNGTGNTLSGNISSGVAGTNTLTIKPNGAGNALILSGVVSNGTGTTALSMASQGTLTLSGANTYSGGTTLSAGTTTATNASALGTGTIAMGASTATLNLSGAMTIANAINLTGSNATISALNYGTTTFSGAITGAGNLTIAAWGNLSATGGGDPSDFLLTGTNNFTGGITMTSGLIDATSSFGNAANAITLNGGGLLFLGGTHSLANTIVLGAGGGTLRAYNGSVGTASGIISGTGALSKTDTGTVILSGANTYTGATSVGYGTLNLTGSLNVGAGTATTSVASGALLTGTGTITAGTVSDSGAGQVSLTGNNKVSTLTTSGTLGAFAFNNDQSLAIGAINAGANAIAITTTPGSAANITLNSGAVLTSTATGTAIELAADANFINNAGSGALSAANGRWLVYSAAPASDTFGSLNSGNTAVWNTANGASVTATGNRYAFAYQPTLTFTSTSASKTYGTTASLASDFSVSGYQPAVSGAYLADTATAYSGAPSLSSSGAAATATVAGGPYAITIGAGTLAALDGYALAYASPGTLTVNKAALTITGATTATTYNGAAQSNGFTTSTLYGSDSVTSVSGLASGTNAGTYTDALSNATGTGLANYTIAYANGSLAIGKASLTLTGANMSVTYNGTAQSNSGATLAGVKGADSFTITGYASGTSAGTYTDALGISANGATLMSNYTLAAPSEGTLTIAKAALTITGATTATTYNGAAQSNGFTTSTLYGSDSVTSVSGLASGTNAGTYTDALSNATGTGLANYTIAYANGSLAIGKASLTLTGANMSVTYNGTAQSNSGATLAGVKGADSFTITGYASGTSAGTYTDALGISANGATVMSNYTLATPTEGTLTIAKAALTITGATTATTYNGAAQSNSFTTSTLYGSDSVTGVSGLASGTNAGTYTDALSNATGTGLANYTIAYANGSLAIGKASLTLTGANTGVTYNGTAQSNGGATLAGVKGADSFTITGYASGTGAGTYTDALGLAANGATVMSNYTLATPTEGTLTIAKAALTITGATTATTYNGAGQSNSFTTSTLYGSDSVTGVSGLASGTNAGTYSDSLSNATGTGLANYTIAYANGSLTIAAASNLQDHFTWPSLYVVPVKSPVFLSPIARYVDDNLKTIVNCASVSSAAVKVNNLSCFGKFGN